MQIDLNELIRKILTEEIPKQRLPCFYCAIAKHLPKIVIAYYLNLKSSDSLPRSKAQLAREVGYQPRHVETHFNQMRSWFPQLASMYCKPKTKERKYIS